jgi:hypothetical protein
VKIEDRYLFTEALEDDCNVTRSSRVSVSIQTKPEWDHLGVTLPRVCASSVVPQWSDKERKSLRHYKDELRLWLISLIKAFQQSYSTYHCCDSIASSPNPNIVSAAVLETMPVESTKILMVA